MDSSRIDAGDARGQLELVSLDVLEARLPTTTTWLTDDESTRLASIGAPLRRRQFLAGHWLARRLAATALDVGEARIGMDRDVGGRPRLLVDGAPSAWHVSLTHSDDQVACVVAPHPVGIDLEVPRRARDLAALARFAFSPAENDALAAVAAEARVAVFYRLWALKEARGKRCGEGLMPKRSRRFTAAPAGTDVADAVTWSLGDVTLAVVGEGVAAFTVRGLPDFATAVPWRIVESCGGDAD